MHGPPPHFSPAWTALALEARDAPLSLLWALTSDTFSGDAGVGFGCSAVYSCDQAEGTQGQALTSPCQQDTALVVLRVTTARFKYTLCSIVPAHLERFVEDVNS